MGNGLSRRDFLRTMALFGAAMTLPGWTPFKKRQSPPVLPPLIEGVQGRPNILFIMTDQERFNLPSPPGFSLPSHERLQANGVTFLKHHVTTAPCTPSRSCMFTGQHVPNTRMFDNINFPYVANLEDRLPTLGHMLRRAGYYTAYKGKWHLSRMEGEEGGAAKKSMIDALQPFGFGEFNPSGDFHGNFWSGHKHDPEIGDEAVGWLASRAHDVRQTQPWCLTVSFVNPHDMMFADSDNPGENVQSGIGPFGIKLPPDEAPYTKRWDVSLPPNLKDDLSKKPPAQLEFLKLLDFFFGKMPIDRPDMYTNLLNYYCNCMRDVDVQIGRVLDALQASGQAENTIVVFTSDHGEMAGAHLQRQKGPFLYDENVHVPLIISHPDGKKGVKTEALSSAVDLVPTLLSFAGIDRNRQRTEFPQLVGYDLSSVVSNTASPGARGEQAGACMFTYDSLNSVDYDFMLALSNLIEDKRLEMTLPISLRPNYEKRGFMRGLYDGRYKFARYFSPVHYNRPKNISDLLAQNDLELYDTHTDPGELNNLANEVDNHRDLITSLNARLEAVIQGEIGDDRTMNLPELPRLRPEPFQR